VAIVAEVIASILCASVVSHEPMLRGIVREPCTLTIDATISGQDALFINCGCGSVVVTSPTNLAGHVTIASSSDALTFVRFFTSMRVSELVDLDGFVEVLPPGASDSEVYVVPKRYRSRASKVQLPRVEPINVGSRTDFEIVRTVVSIDGSIYKLREVVTSCGEYEERSRQMLYRHSTEVGITHFGPL
jgi:hypothetical protein